MITKNFIQFLTIYTDDNSNIKFKFKDIFGKDKDNSCQYNWNTNINCTSVLFTRYTLKSVKAEINNYNDANTGLFLGSGGTSPTADDYKLENMIEYSDDGLKIMTESLGIHPQDDVLYVYNRTVKNNSDSPITISESGMISTSYKIGIFLWARETFDPITIQPGEVRSFTMTISI